MLVKTCTPQSAVCQCVSKRPSAKQCTLSHNLHLHVRPPGSIATLYTGPAISREARYELVPIIRVRGIVDRLGCRAGIELRSQRLQGAGWSEGADARGDA